MNPSVLELVLLKGFQRENVKGFADLFLRRVSTTERLKTRLFPLAVGVAMRTCFPS
jgi:hypothetical protein